MSGLDKDRKRNQTIAFRMTPEERQELEARIKVTGKPKGIYFIECASLAKSASCGMSRSG